MRHLIKLKGTSEIVPFDNQSMLNSYIHTCLGENNPYHDTKNDYAISSLQGCKMAADKSGLDFSNGGYFTISSLNYTFHNDIFKGMFRNPKLFCGLEIETVVLVNEKFYDGWNNFASLSPFIIKNYTDKKNYRFATLNDENFIEVVEAHTRNKVSKILGREVDLKIEIPNHPSHKVKSILVKNCRNQANLCQVSIHCSAEVAELIYNIGLGQSTGSGFGTLYLTTNREMYRN